MSVLACGRFKCDNIMCDRLVLGRYLCNACYEELLEFKRSWGFCTRVTSVRPHLEHFMTTAPGTFARDDDDAAVDAEFHRLTGGGA